MFSLYKSIAFLQAWSKWYGGFESDLILYNGIVTIKRAILQRLRRI